MARVVFFALLAVAAVSGFVMPSSTRGGALAPRVAASGVADALASDIDYETAINKMEVEAKERVKKAFDDATAQSNAESEKRWAALKADMQEAAKSIGM